MIGCAHEDCIFFDRKVFHDCYIVDKTGTLTVNHDSQCIHYKSRKEFEPKPKRPTNCAECKNKGIGAASGLCAILNGNGMFSVCRNKNHGNCLDYDSLKEFESKQIEKINYQFGEPIPHGYIDKDHFITTKINELIDAVNELNDAMNELKKAKPDCIYINGGK